MNVVWAYDGRYVRQRRDARDRPGDGTTLTCVRELAGLGVEHDLVGIAGLRGEALLEQIHRALRPGTRQGEVARDLGPRRARDASDRNRDCNPAEHYDAAVVHRPAGEAKHHFKQSFTRRKFARCATYNAS